MQQKCPVCDATILCSALYDYVKCSACNSYIYVSDHSAQDDNRNFYDSFYPRWKEYKTSRTKLKTLMFKRFEKADRKLNEIKWAKFRQARKEIDSLFGKDKKLIEIGFGEGKRLVRFLKAGFDIYGIDISESVVNYFREEYPKYRDRVEVGTTYNGKIDVVYCCALFEHLDNPQQFVDNLSVLLPQNGLVVLDALPIVAESPSNLTINEDINFWKPCHRIICSQEALKRLFQQKGYRLLNYGIIDAFSHRVLSIHVRRGYDEVINLRDSRLRHFGLPGIFKYYSICQEALRAKSLAVSGSFAFIKEQSIKG